MTALPVASIDQTCGSSRRWIYPLVKRLFDIVVAIAGLIAVSPLFVIAAILIRCESPGPVFYRGKRTGRYGRPFRIFKFRSMIVNAEQCGGTTTADNDPRITRVGNFLRKCKLDELPQLINVIKGDMSLVGPRPEVQEYTDLFSEDEKRILSVRPGITDLSSLKFHDLQAVVGSHDVDRVFRESILPQKNALRLKYVDERSFLGDLAILAQTLRTISGRVFRSHT